MTVLRISQTRLEVFDMVKEYYNALTANIRLSGQDNKVICVTSVQPNEGKSTTSTHLAITFADAGYKTLLIDCDMRNSIMSGTFKANGKFWGLSNYLAGEAELIDSLCETNVPNLSVIASGSVPPNPTTLLQSVNFANMIKVLRKYYDYIIVDTPPIGLVVDAVLIAQNCDASMMVTASGETKRKALQKAAEQMQATGAQFMGVVLNKYDVTTDNYGAYGSYGVYGNYGNYGG